MITTSSHKNRAASAFRELTDGPRDEPRLVNLAAEVAALGGRACLGLVAPRSVPVPLALVWAMSEFGVHFFYGARPDGYVLVYAEVRDEPPSEFKATVREVSA